MPTPISAAKGPCAIANDSNESAVARDSSAISCRMLNTRDQMAGPASTWAISAKPAPAATALVAPSAGGVVARFPMLAWVMGSANAKPAEEPEPKTGEQARDAGAPTAADEWMTAIPF